MTTQKNPKQQLINTTNINDTKPHETKAWFGSSFTPSGQETNRRGRTGLESKGLCYVQLCYKIKE